MQIQQAAFSAAMIVFLPEIFPVNFSALLQRKKFLLQEIICN